MDLIDPTNIRLLSTPAQLNSRLDEDKINPLRAKAEELEGVFLNTLVSQMFTSLDARGTFGGGFAEETWRSMQSEQYANLMAKNGGFGLADQIMSDLLNAQESAQLKASQSQPRTHLEAQGAYQQ